MQSGSSAFMSRLELLVEVVFLHLYRDIFRTPNSKVVALTHLQ
jgi:hypothetical protein